MNLVTTESLGYVVDTPKEAPLVIPASAPLITGTRAVVYVQLPGKEKPTFEGRGIILGPRAGDYYLVKEGLAEGEMVVTRGNFKIDASLQIQAKPSMMSAEPSQATTEHQPGVQEPFREIAGVPDAFRGQIWSFVEKYLSLHETLAADDKDAAIKAAHSAIQVLSQVDMSLVSGKTHEAWMSSVAGMNKALGAIKEGVQIEAARQAFERLSNELIAVVRQFGIPENQVLYRFHCPMAFNNRGADWLQQDENTRNPYFGASMLKCGEVAEVIGVKTR
jgi:Cu(I)/Ag(I) efflux system membrane fusion protein